MTCKSRHISLLALWLERPTNQQLVWFILLLPVWPRPLVSCVCIRFWRARSLKKQADDHEGEPHQGVLLTFRCVDTAETRTCRFDACRLPMCWREGRRSEQRATAPAASLFRSSELLAGRFFQGPAGVPLNPSKGLPAKRRAHMKVSKGDAQQNGVFP